MAPFSFTGGASSIAGKSETRRTIASSYAGGKRRGGGVKRDPGTVRGTLRDALLDGCQRALGWEDDRNACALTKRALQADLGAMHVHQTFDDRKAEP